MAGKKKQAQLTPEEKLQQALVPEAEQPYKVPANWCWTRQNIACYLSDIEKIVNGEHPYLEAKFLRGLKKPKIVSAGKFINKSSKVILVDGENSGEVFDIFVDGYMGSTFRLLCFSEIVYEQYCRYFIIINKEIYSKSKKGSAIPHLNKELFFNMPFPLPPLTEQQRIVERIESLFAKLDEAKENLQNVLEGFETRKAAILHKAFTGELTAKWRKQHGVSMESWESVKVSNLCENIVCGKTPTSYIDNNGDIPYLKVYNIVNNKIDFDSKPQYIPKKIHESKLKSSILKPKDVIMNIVGPPLRKIAIIPDTYSEWNMNQAIVRFRTKEKLYYKYLYYYLIYPKTLDDIICETKGVVGQANISITQSRNLNINLPTFSEQTEIVRIIDELFVKEQQAKELAENTLAKIDLIKKSILARAFRGELGTNNPADEPAVELLKRML